MTTICQIRSLGDNLFSREKKLEELSACCRKKSILHIPCTQSSNPEYNFSSGSATRSKSGHGKNTKQMYMIYKKMSALAA